MPQLDKKKPTTRISISFPKKTYDTLLAVAGDGSVAELVRRYVDVGMELDEDAFLLECCAQIESEGGDPVSMGDAWNLLNTK